MSEDKTFHESHNDKEMQVLVDGFEGMTLSFVGRPDYGTVTMYIIDPETLEPQVPVFECEREHFETVLEQASGALMNAEGNYPSMPHFEEAHCGGEGQ
jgi:hypothetical protein